MFDIGFWELMLIGVMGLVVLGPERLPIAIRTIRGWITGARKFTDTMKSELSEELRVHELHANLKKKQNKVIWLICHQRWLNPLNPYKKLRQW